MYSYKKIIIEGLKKISETKKEKSLIGDEIHLPDLVMKKTALIKYLKNNYNLTINEE